MRVPLFRNNAFIKALWSHGFRASFRALSCVAVIAVLGGMLAPAAYATVLPARTAPKPAPKPAAQAARVMLPNVPDDLIPQQSNIWKCTCDTDGCWPGCFTIAAASIAKYWSLRGYPNLWNGDENGTFARLRDLFPNLFCYDNINNDGKPSESGYDAFDVATGFNTFLTERGYRFAVTALPGPSFEQIMAEIDAGRPVIGAFSQSPWGSHAATVIGYDTTGGKQIMIVRPNLFNKRDIDLTWNVGYGGFGIVTIIPQDLPDLNNVAALKNSAVITQAEPVAPASFDLIVNDSDPGFSVRGAWTTANGVGFGGEAHVRQTTDPTNLGPQDDTASVAWSPELPFDGIWQVMAYMPVTDTEDTTAHSALYRVSHAEGMSLIRRAPNELPQGWTSLGDFPFAKGISGTVYLGDKTDDDLPRTLYADAMRFLWRAPLVIRSEDDTQTYLVMGGKRHRIPDDDTFGALRLSRGNIRALSSIAFAQYAEAEPLPSVYGGWVGQYFNNNALGFPFALIRSEGNLRFRWNGVAPAANMGATRFSARWTRMFALSEGEYPFSLEAVGGVRLWVDGQLQIDGWDAPEQLLAHQKSVAVASGLHRVEVEYRAGQSYAQVVLGNLPPNAPIILDSAPVQWQTTPTVTMQWADAGDADSIEKNRKFFVTLWREENQQSVWRTTSNWITDTQWTVALPDDGRYQWSVVSSDGTANSSASAPRTFLLDRSAPWSQMQRAQSKTISPTLQQPQTKPIEVSGDLRGAEVIANVEGKQSLVIQQRTGSGIINTDAISMYGNLPAVRLTWWATDTLSGPSSYDVQARETVRANTVYTISTSEQQVPRIMYDLVLSGSQEISQVVVVTDVLVYTTVIPLLVFEPISPTEWLTVATGLRETGLLFIGNPGSTYEFRVRASDAAGNQQPWYEGYSIQADIDPNTVLIKRFAPFVEVGAKDPALLRLAVTPATTVGVTPTATSAITPGGVLVNPTLVPTLDLTQTLPLETPLPVMPTPELIVSATLVVTPTAGLAPTETPLPTQEPPPTLAPTALPPQPTETPPPTVAPTPQPTALPPTQPAPNTDGSIRPTNTPPSHSIPQPPAE